MESVADQPHAGAASVLLVDDSADLRLLLRMAFERFGGCQVVGEAADGRAGVDRASELHPDVVVLDLRMPVMSGAQALPLLRSASPGSKVVVFSAHRSEMLDVQPDAFIEKGAPLADVVRTVLEIAGR